MSDRIKTLYGQLVRNGYDLGGYEKFNAAMHDSNRRRSLYNQLVANRADLGGYEKFSSVVETAPRTAPSAPQKKSDFVADTINMLRTPSSQYTRPQPSKAAGTFEMPSKYDIYHNMPDAVKRHQTPTPLKPEAVMPSVPSSAAESVWAAADKAAGAEVRKKVDEGWSWRKIMQALSSGASVTGGLGDDNAQALETTSVAHLKTHDLQKLSDQAWAALGSKQQQSIINDSYIYLKEQYPDADDKALVDAARKMARAKSDEQMYNLAVEKNMPKSVGEFFLRKAAAASSFGSLSKGYASMMAGTRGDMEAEDTALQKYGAKHKVADIAGSVAGFAVDPLTYASGAVGGAATKVTLWAGGKVLSEAAARKMSQTLGGKLLLGAVSGAANFGTFEAGGEAINQYKWGGTLDVDPETGRYVVGDFSLDKVASQMRHGLTMGGLTGAFGTWLGNVSTKAAQATTSTLGKLGVRAGELGVGLVGEGTIFATPEFISTYGDYNDVIKSVSDKNSPNYIADDKERSKYIAELKAQRGERMMDIWQDNLAMIAGFKAQHAIKSAGRTISELAASRRGKVGFVERMGRMLDGHPSLALSKEEQAELDKHGYGDLTQMVKEYKAYAQKDGDLPYNKITQLLNDKNVSEAARAKMYYYVTGHSLPMSAVIASNVIDNGDKTYTVQSLGDNGVITSRTYGSRKRADYEKARIDRQAELNGVAMAEQMFDNMDKAERLKAVCTRLAQDKGVSPETLLWLTRKDPKQMTAAEKRWIKEIEDAANEDAPQGENATVRHIKGVILDEYGVDVDKALRKAADSRTDAEKTAISAYNNELAQAVAERKNAISQGETTDAYRRGYEADTQGMRDAYVAQMYEPSEDNAETLRGVESQITESAKYQAALERDELTQMTHKDGSIHLATLKDKDKDGNGKQVYIVDGDIVMKEDGSGIDADASSKSVIIYDPATGEKKMVSPTAVDGIESLGEVKTAEQREAEINARMQDTIQSGKDWLEGNVANPVGMQIQLGDGRIATIEAMHEDGKSAIATLPDGTQFLVPNDVLQRIVNNGQYADYKARRDAEARNREAEQSTESAPETATEGGQPLPEEVSPKEEESREYAQGDVFDVVVDGQKMHAEIVSPKDADGRFVVNVDDGESMRTLYVTPEELAAMEYREEPSTKAEETRLATEDSSDKALERGAQPTEEHAPTALERIPRDEKGNAQFHDVDTETAWDGLVEMSGNEETAHKVAEASLANAEKRLKAAKALKEKGETPEELLRSIKENEAAVAEAQRVVDAWKAIVGEKASREEAAKAEAERIATEKAEAERKAAEERERAEKEEKTRIEAEKKEAERIAAEKAEEEARVEAERKAEEERIAKQKAEEKTAEAESDKEEAEKRMDDEEPKPLGSGVFGNIYNQFKGKVKEAFDFLMKHKGGDLLGVFHRKDVGDIDLVWGDHGGGLAHIIRRHIIEQNDFKNVDEIQKVIEDVIRNGLIVRENKDKINIEYNGYRVSIKKTIRDSKGNVVENKNWIVTAFDKSKPKHEKRNPSSSETLTTPSANQKADGVTLPSNEDSIDKGSKKAEKKQKKQSVFDKAKEITDKEEKKRKAEAEDDSVLGQAARAVGKKKKVNLFKYTASQKDAGEVMKGVHYANGYAYASDGYILFKEKADYPKEWEGTTRDKDGNLIDGKYPDAEKAIHRLVHIPDKEVESLPSKEVLDFAIAASKKLKGEAIPVAIDGIFFNAVNLKKFLEAVASKGMDKVVYRHPMLYATNGKDEIVMMPTVNTLEGALDIADRMERAGLPKEQIDAWKAHIEAADKKMSFEDFQNAEKNAKRKGVRLTEAESPKRKADERYQRGEGGVKPSKAEVALRDAVIDRLRESGMDVIADEAEGQRVLDEVNGRAKVQMGDAPETFAERQKQAVESHGVVMPGLNESYVEVVKDIPRHEYTGSIAEATREAIDAAKRKYAGKELTYNNYGANFNYTISANAIDICLSPKHQNLSANKGIHLALAEHLDEVINKSVEVEEHPDYIKGKDGKRGEEVNPNAIMHRFYGVAVIDGTPCRVMTLMREDGRSEEANGVHSYEVQKIEVLDNESPSTSNGVGTQMKDLSAYPLAKLLKGVEKSYDKGKYLLDESKKRSVGLREQRVDGADGVRFFRTANGEAYGFTVGGRIYIDPRIATSETPVHEYAHLWAEALRNGNPKEWQNVVELMKGTKVWDEVKARYPELKSDDEIADEVIATYSGRRGAERLREEQRKIAEGNGGVFEKAEAVNALERVKQALKKFWNGVADFLHIHYKSAEEVADRVMKDLLEGVDPRKMGKTKDGGVRFSAKQKRALETASLGNVPRSLTVVSSAAGANVLNNIENLAKEFEKSATQPKTFIGDVAKALGASRFGSGSEYATFETKNGNIVTIRLANHNAHVSGFDHNDKDNGISIVISPKPNEGITNDGNAHITEFYYDSIKLRRAEGKPLAEIVRSIKQALYSGEFKDTTGLAERQEVNGEDVIRYQSSSENSDKTLAGVHNITEEKLRKALKLGGLANPSVAVIDISKNSHEGFGEISLILPSEKVAKRTGKNAGTWQGDAWTPTYPQIERRMSNKGAEKASKDVLSVPSDMYSEVRIGLDRWLDSGEANSAMAYMFLHEKGVAPEPKKIQPKFSDEAYNELKSITAGNFNIYGISKADAQKVLAMYIDAYFDGDKDLYEDKTKAWLEKNRSIVDAGDKGGMRYAIAKENVKLYDEYGFNYRGVQTFVRDVEYDHRNTGVDMNATLNEVEDYIKTNSLTDEFNTWQEGKEKEYGIKEVIFDGFTPSGNRRYIPNTLENVSKIMKKQGRNGATGAWASFPNFAARLMPSYGTLEDIRSKKGLLTSDREKIDDFREKWSKVFFELGMKCQPDATGTFDDYGFDRLSEAAMTSDPQAFLKQEYNVDFSDEDTKRLKKMVKAIKEEYPAMYFETKFERPVYLNEFAAVVVPNDLGADVKKALSDLGIAMYEYDASKEGDRSRAFDEAVKSSGKIRFQFIGEKGAAEADHAEEVFANENVERSVRESRSEKTELTAEERELRDNLVERMRKGGLDVVTDSEEMQRVIGTENERTRMTGAGSVREHRVYHGSGADFDAFDHSHMGEGEGAQAYGWGTYVTEVEGIGKTYAIQNTTKHNDALRALQHDVDAISDQLNRHRDDLKYDEEQLKRANEWRAEAELDYELFRDEAEELKEKYGEASPKYRNHLFNDIYTDEMKRAQSSVKSMEESIQYRKEKIAELEKALKDKQAEIDELPKEFPRHLYTVEIPDDNGGNYLDWNGHPAESLLKGVGSFLESEGFERVQDSPVRYEKGESTVVLNPNATGADLYAELREALGSDKKASQALAELGCIGIKYPADNMRGGREDGAKNYVIFNENDAKITDHTRFLRTADGEVYGLVKDGRIYLDPKMATSETAVHEYTHLWGDMLRRKDSEQWSHTVKELKNSVLWEEVKELYPELKTDDEIADEVLSTFSGRRGAERLREEARRVADGEGGVFTKAKAIETLERVKEAIARFWEGVARMFGINRYRSAEELADMAMRDLLDSKNPMKDESGMRKRGEVGDEGVKSLKGEEALTALDSIFGENEGSAIPPKISSFAKFKNLFKKPVRTFLGELVQVKEEVWNKILRNNRQDITGTVLPTIENADFAIRDTDGSTLYVKRFKGDGQERMYNVVVVNKHGEVEDYISSVHIKRDNNLRNKIKKGAELFLPNARTTDGTMSRNNSTPGAKVANYSETAKPRYSRKPGESIFDYASRVSEDVDRSVRERVSARDEYEKKVKSKGFQTKEALQNSMLGLQEFMSAIDHASGNKRYIEDIPDFENPILGENRLSSVNKEEMHQVAKTQFKPLMSAVAKLSGKGKESGELYDYMFAKHGLERDAVMRQREAQKEFDKYQKANPKGTKTIGDFVASLEGKDYAGLTALTAEDGRVKSIQSQIDAIDEQMKATDDQLLLRKLGGQKKRLKVDLLNAARDAADDIRKAFESNPSHDRSDINELWKRVNEVNGNTLRKLYESGMLTKEAYNDISSMYTNYIPMRGFDQTTSADAYAYLTHGDSAFNAPIKTAKGRSSKADNPIAYMQAMAESAIMQGNRNVLVKQKMLNFVRNHPSDLASISDVWLQYDSVADEWKPVFPDNIGANDSASVVAKKMEAFEDKMKQMAEKHPDLVQRSNEAPDIPYKVVEKGQLNEHQVLVKQNGKSYIITVNGSPRAAQAANGLTNPDTDLTGAIGKIFEGAEALNRQLSSLYTTLNPDFIGSNYVRDALYSNTMVYVKEGAKYGGSFNLNFAKYNPAEMANLYARYNKGSLDTSNETHKLFLEFMQNGGETGFVNLKQIEKRKSEIAKAIKRDGEISAAQIWGGLGDAVDFANRAVENSARFAAYVTSRKSGRSVGRSVYDAKEISVNFNRKGSGSKFMGAEGQTKAGNAAAFVSGAGRGLYIFWNAGLQGLTNFSRQIGRHPGRALTLASLLFGFGALMSYLGNRDDDDENNYFNLPKYIRRSNVCYKIGDLFVTIPLPVEYRAFYGLGELASSTLAGKEDGTTKDIAKEAVSQVSQLFPIDFVEGGGGLHALIPSAVKPIVEAETNTAWTGLPIYKDNDFNKNMPEYTKVYKTANGYLVEIARALNDATGGNKYKKGFIDINPAKMEYVLKGMLGGAFSFPDKLVKTTETIMGDREFDWRNTPFANRFVKNADERTEYKSLNEQYFKLKDEMDVVKQQVKGFEKEADAGNEKYEKALLQLEDSKDYERLELFKDYEKELKGLNDELKELRMSPDYDKAEEKELQKEIAEQQRQLLDEMREIKK